VCLLSDIIQHFVDKKMDFDSSYVYEDIKRSIEFVHQSGKMHDKILAEPSKYLVKNNDVCHMLKSLKESGKKLFILTNSPFPFVDGGMRYLFQDQGNNGEGWKELFDVVVALADKPKFYTSDRPFRYFLLNSIWQYCSNWLFYGSSNSHLKPHVQMGLFYHFHMVSYQQLQYICFSCIWLI
jgi:HAD superfamily 5'-nucleotidase-like hydrolase